MAIRRINVNLDEKLYSDCQDKAAKEGYGFNGVVRALLKAWLDGILTTRPRQKPVEPS